MRLELLEGVVAFHSGEQQLAKQRLQAAQERWEKLQVRVGRTEGTDGQLHGMFGASNG